MRKGRGQLWSTRLHHAAQRREAAHVAISGSDGPGLRGKKRALAVPRRAPGSYSRAHWSHVATIVALPLLPKRALTLAQELLTRRDRSGVALPAADLLLIFCEVGDLRIPVLAV